MMHLTYFYVAGFLILTKVAVGHPAAEMCEASLST